MMEKKKILQAKNVVKIYGSDEKNQVTALDHVSLDVFEGDFITIMGPSGAGKSTFLNNISTIDLPTSGSVKINGTEVRTMGEIEIGRFRYENLGFIFQEFNLLGTLTILENIAVPLTLKNVARSEIVKRVEAIAEKLEITRLLHKFPDECSGGQRQRVAIARALVTNPKLIVADEPTGNLDSKNSYEILKILKELNENDGVTIIMVTHDSMIASYSKKLIYIRDGKIDDIVERGELSQRDYFYRIVEINSKESQDLFYETGNRIKEEE